MVLTLCLIEFVIFPVNFSVDSPGLLVTHPLLVLPAFSFGNRDTILSFKFHLSLLPADPTVWQLNLIAELPSLYLAPWLVDILTDALIVGIALLATLAAVLFSHPAALFFHTTL